MAKIKIVLMIEDTPAGTIISATPEIDIVPENVDDITDAMALGVALNEGLRNMVKDIFSDCEIEESELH